MISSRSAWVRAGAVAMLASLVTACSSSDLTSTADTADNYTGPQVTLLVTNATCQAGHCDSINVMLYPQHELITPAGLWSVSLGIVSGPEACLTVPMSAVQRIVGPVTQVITNPDGTMSYAPGDHPDTTMVTWTPNLPAALGETAPVSYFQDRTPSTDEFVPANGTGWSVTLPGGEPVAGARCTT